MIHEIKGSKRTVSLVRCCWLLGISPQSYYQHFRKEDKVGFEQDILIAQIQHIRKTHPMIGCRKLHWMLCDFMVEHRIKIGRDKLFDLLNAHQLLIRRKKRRVQTTYSRHWLRKHPNLAKDIQPKKPNELWVADITYFPLKKEFIYISLITDAYSKKIVGYNASKNMTAADISTALHMAISNAKESLAGLIHHSDRGIQYCSKLYTQLLEQNNIFISMTQSGDPLENPIAERVNGILKSEYLHPVKISSLKELMERLDLAIIAYNQSRPHLSCSMNTPAVVHSQNLIVNKKWKNYYKSKLTFVNSNQD